MFYDTPAIQPHLVSLGPRKRPGFLTSLLSLAGYNCLLLISKAIPYGRGWPLSDLGEHEYGSSRDLNFSHPASNSPPGHSRQRLLFPIARHLL